MKSTKRVASGAMLAAVCIVLMLLGAVLELGMYAAPLLAGVCLIPYGQKYGRKYQLIVYAAVSLLSLMLVPNIEQNLMFVCFFGWYPLLRDRLQKLRKPLRIALKILVFNLAVISIEALVMLVLVPEALGGFMTVLLLIMGNVTFILYDYVIPFLSLRLGKVRDMM